MFEIRMLLAFLVYSLIVSLVTGQQFQEENSYCELNREHTMCRYAGLGGNCLPRFLRNPTNRNVSTFDAMEIVDIHNRLRNRVASNQTIQFPAANMMVMQWDSELANIAQRWADQCRFEHDCADCRRVGPSIEDTVGQSVFMDWNLQKGGVLDWNRTIHTWFDEISVFPDNVTSAVERFQFNSTHQSGHYTQLVWARTNRVGCGVITFTRDERQQTLYVCNYGEMGNFLNQPIYTIGEGCSDCPGRCSSLYNSLCEAPRLPFNPALRRRIDPFSRTARLGNSVLNRDYSDSYDVPSYSNVPLHHGSYPRYDVPNYSNVPLHHGSYPRYDVPNYSNVPLHHGSYPRHGNRYNVPVPTYSNVPLHHSSYPRYGYSFPRYYVSLPIQYY